ncbi:hypothetical protein ABVT39_027725 [Epinephelus coioides]
MLYKHQLSQLLSDAAGVTEMAEDTKAQRDRWASYKEEVRKWRADKKSYIPPPEFRFMKPFWPPLEKRRRRTDSSRRSGQKETPSTSKTPPTPLTPTPATQQPQPGTSKSRKAPIMCPACGKATTIPGHFVHKSKTFCPSTSGGVSLEEWMKDNVPKTTRWRWKVKQKQAEAGQVQPKKEHHICKQCNLRMTRESGHSVHRATRQSFCQATDPLCRTVEEWLTEIRGGVSTEEFVKANLKKRWRRYHQKPEVRERRLKKRREEYREKRRKEEEKRKKEEEERRGGGGEQEREEEEEEERGGRVKEEREGGGEGKGGEEERVGEEKVTEEKVCNLIKTEEICQGLRSGHNLQREERIPAKIKKLSDPTPLAGPRIDLSHTPSKANHELRSPRTSTQCRYLRRPTPPSPWDQVSVRLTDRAHQCAAQTAAAANNITLLSSVSTIGYEMATDIGKAMSAILTLSTQARIMAWQTMLQRNMWLHMSQLPAQIRRELLDDPINSDGLFGPLLQSATTHLQNASEEVDGELTPAEELTLTNKGRPLMEGVEGESLHLYKTELSSTAPLTAQTGLRLTPGAGPGAQWGFLGVKVPLGGLQPEEKKRAAAAAAACGVTAAAERRAAERSVSLHKPHQITL